MKRIPLTILALLIPLWLGAAELHVGSGQTYATIGEAITASSAGDTIYVHTGTYDEYDLRPKSGSDNTHRTVISGVTGEARPVISHTGQTIFNIENLNYITLQYLEIAGGTGNEDGAIILGQDYNSTYITIDHCKVTGTTPTSNAAAIRLQGGSYFTITNCELIGNGYKGSTGALGVSGIKADGHYLSNITIENNYLHDCFQGVGFKWGTATDKTITIQKNYIVNTGQRAIYASQGYLTIKNNVIYNYEHAESDPKDWAICFGEDWNGNNCTVDHNTIYGCTIALIFRSADAINNVITNNIYYSNATVTNEPSVSYDLGTPNRNFTSDPSFANAVGGDFTLGAGSGAIDYCADGSDSGADMSNIGIDGTQAGAGGAGPAPPTLSFYLTNPSGSGAAQGSPHNSLGGYRSTTQVSASAMKNLFDDVTVAESIVGDTEYRFLDVYNSGDSSATKVQVFVSSDTSSSGTEITIGYNSANQPHEDSWDGEDVANEDTAPASPSLTFGTYTRASPLHLGTIPAGRSSRICVKRVVSPGALFSARDVGTIAVRYLGD